MNIEGILGVCIPLFALSIPIVKILTNHQKEMAQTFAQQHMAMNAHSPEVAQVREDVRLLREQLNQQSILLDDIRTQSRNLQERVGENA